MKQNNNSDIWISHNEKIHIKRSDVLEADPPKKEEFTGCGSLVSIGTCIEFFIQIKVKEKGMIYLEGENAINFWNWYLYGDID
jgi:hypothetical protein